MPIASRQDARKRVMRPFWAAEVAALLPQYPPFGNTGTVFHIHPARATNGAGTFADPMNALPSPALWDGNTLLIAEGTTLAATISRGVGGSYNLGCYSLQDGSRLCDLRRAATVCIGTAPNVVSLSTSGSTGTIVVSGLRLTGSRNAAGTANGLYAGNGTPGSRLLIEHCVIDDVEGSSTGAMLSARCDQHVIRFCRAVGQAADLIWSRANSGNAQMDVYGCELIVTDGVTFTGPDGIELVRNPGAAWTRCRFYANWVEHRANCKQAFLLASNRPPAGSESVWIFRNFFFGLDVTSLPDLSGNHSGQVAVSVDAPGVRVYRNYFDNWRVWANANGDPAARALFAYNLCITDAQQWNAGTWTMAGSAAAGSDHVIVAHNTFVTTHPMTMPDGVACFRLSGTHNVVRNNVFAGPWQSAFRFHGGAGQTEDHNLFWGVTGAPILGAQATSTLPASPDDLFVDPLLDFAGRPQDGSPLVAAATPVSDWDGSLLAMPDVFGNVAHNPKRQWIGAVQSFAYG